MPRVYAWMAIPIIALTAAGSAAVTTNAAAGVTARSRITSVVITGTVSKPVITIHGHGFGARPHTHPGYHPPGHPLCPVQKPTGNLHKYGFDYGTHIYLSDSSQSPAWSAGRYRPSLGELDCIGIVITKYTPSTIRFRLGAAYPRYPGAPAHYRLASGDHYTVGVNGTHVHGRVAYR